MRRTWTRSVCKYVIFAALLVMPASVVCAETDTVELDYVCNIESAHYVDANQRYGELSNAPRTLFLTEVGPSQPLEAPHTESFSELDGRMRLIVRDSDGKSEYYFSKYGLHYNGFNVRGSVMLHMNSGGVRRIAVTKHAFIGEEMIRGVSVLFGVCMEIS